MAPPLAKVTSASLSRASVYAAYSLGTSSADKPPASRASNICNAQIEQELKASNPAFVIKMLGWILTCVLGKHPTPERGACLRIKFFTSYPYRFEGI